MSYNILKDGITQSMICNFLSCPRKFRFACEGWCKKEMLNVVIGSVGHAALDDIHSGKKIQPFTYDKTVPTYLKEISKAIVFTTIPLYEKFHKAQDTKIKFKCEQVFDTPLEVIDSGKIRLRGKVDAWRSDNYLLETKWKSRISEDGIELSLGHDLQSLFYTLVYTSLGLKPKGVIYDVVRYPQWNQGSKVETLIVKIKDEAGSNPEHYFKRFRTEYTEKDMEDFYINLQKILTRIINGDNTKNYCACNSPFTCDFIKLCMHGDKTGLVKKPLFSELSV